MLIAPLRVNAPPGQSGKDYPDGGYPVVAYLLPPDYSLIQGLI